MQVVSMRMMTAMIMIRNVMIMMTTWTTIHRVHLRNEWYVKGNVKPFHEGKKRSLI